MKVKMMSTLPPHNTFNITFVREFEEVDDDTYKVEYIDGVETEFKSVKILSCHKGGN